MTNEPRFTNPRTRGKRLATICLGSALLLTLGALTMVRAKTVRAIDRRPDLTTSNHPDAGASPQTGEVVLHGPGAMSLFKLQFLRRRLVEARRKGDAADIAEIEKRIGPLEARIAHARQREAGGTAPEARVDGGRSG